VLEDTGKRAWLPGWFWPSFAFPGSLWLVALFVIPFYVLLSVAFGTLNPIFLTPEPVFNPLHWQFHSFSSVVGQIFTSGSVYQAGFVRTIVYVAVATALCLLIGYPVAYFLARHAGRFKTVFLVGILAPFFISYMMRMLAWISLLQVDGYVNRILLDLHVIGEPVAWLEGRPSTVIFGLTYGYVPFMILPLYATLDRIDTALLEASRDLGLGQIRTFLHTTLPLSRQAILAGCVIVSLPMFGDYYTQSLLAATRNTAMIGNLIVNSIQSSLVAEGASLVVILLILLIFPIIFYLRSTRRAQEVLGG